MKLSTRPETDTVSPEAANEKFKQLVSVPPAGLPKLIVLEPVVDAYEKYTLLVPVYVKLVAVPILNITPALPDICSIPVVPNAIDLTLELADEKRPQVSVLLFKSKVPAVNVTVAVVAVEKASCKTQEPPVPLNTVGGIVLLFVVIVFPVDVDAKVVAFVPLVSVIPVDNV